MPLDILLTNDDGFSAAGLTTLHDALTAAGHNVHVVAPLANQSAQGSSLGGLASVGAPLAVDEYAPGNYSVDGRPVAAALVGLDVLDLFGGEAPDLVVSGTNRGDNAGASNNISGTVNAALAALHEGVPAIALSAGSGGGSYDAAYVNGADFLVGLLDRLEAERPEGGPLLPAGQGLGINIPGPADLDGVAVTRVDRESSTEFPIVARGNGLYGSDAVPSTDPSGNPISEGSQFVENRLTVSPLDGDWTAPEAVRLGLEGRLDGRLGDGEIPHHGPLDIMLVDEDGIAAPGLAALRDALSDAGFHVTVVAPATDQSGVGTALTLGDFAVRQVEPDAYAVSATPTTTVYTALDALFTGDHRPDLVISGIDEGTSLGLQGNSSATLAAAVAGVFNYDVPSISAVLHAGFDGTVSAGEYHDAAVFLTDMVAELQATAPASGALLPTDTGLSINFPEMFDPEHVAFTRADASTDQRLVALPGTEDSTAAVDYDGPVLTDDPLGEGNAFLHGHTTITAFDGNYGSAEIGTYDRIAALLGTSLGVPADAVLA